MKRRTYRSATIWGFLLISGTTLWAGNEHDHSSGAKPVESSSHVHTENPRSDNDDHDHDSGEHADEVKLTPAAIDRYGITVAPAGKSVLRTAFAAPARVAFNADAMAHVSSAVTGRVSELRIKLGDNVKRGDVLFVVDSPELGQAQSEYLLKRKAVDAARPAVQLAKEAYDRAKLLLDQNQSIALAEVQKRESEWRTAEGNLRSAEATVIDAENKLYLYGMSEDAVATLARTGKIAPHHSIIAPINGQIIERKVSLGELVSPDRDALMVIADVTSIWVIADVPETHVADVIKGSSVRIRSASLKDRTIEGTVNYIAPAIDPNTRTAKVRVELTDPTGALKPGMFVETTILPPGDGEAVLTIPEEAVQTVDGGPVVFVPVAGEPHTFAKKSIKIGPPIHGLVQVFDGLDEGDVLVVSGGFILKAELGKARATHEH